MAHTTPTIPPGGFAPQESAPAVEKLRLSEDEWRQRLSPKRFHVLRRKGTERAFSGEYWRTDTPGTYVCAGCGLPLFSSEAKYQSSCGWPSFTHPIEHLRLGEELDTSFGMRRVEVACARCEGHLGHVFRDGPPPQGLRYCINSASLRLEESGS